MIPNGVTICNLEADLVSVVTIKWTSFGGILLQATFIHQMSTVDSLPNRKHVKIMWWMARLTFVTTEILAAKRALQDARNARAAAHAKHQAVQAIRPGVKGGGKGTDGDS